jgi:hypothetical protein
MQITSDIATCMYHTGLDPFPARRAAKTGKASGKDKGNHESKNT